MFLEKVNITANMQIDDLTNILRTAAGGIYEVVNIALKMFFNDITIFEVPVGYITLTLVIVFAIWHTLLDTLHND